MRVLVTGASGFLGSHVADQLVANKHDLRLLLRRTSNTEHIEGLRYDRIDGDVRDSKALRRAVEGVDAVIHVAGATTALDEATYQAVNAQGTATIVRAAFEASVKRFVYVSSLAAQGPSRTGSPEDSIGPINAYGRSKLAGEIATLAARDEMSVAVVRPPIVYGPRDRGLLPFYRFVKLGLLPLYGDGMHRMTWIHAHDAADAIVAAVETESPTGAVYSIADGEAHTWRELAETLVAAYGKRAVMLTLPPTLFTLAGYAAGAVSAVLRRPLPLTPEKVVEMRERFWVCDSARIEADLGWRPTIGIEAGIPSTLDWYRAHGWL